MIQDIAPHKLHNEYRPHAKMRPESPVYYFRNRDLLVKKEGDSYRIPRREELRGVSDCLFLFTLDETEYFLCRNENLEIPEGFQFKHMRDIRKEGVADKTFVFPAVTAFQLSNWYNDNRFCGTCGQKTRLSHSERALVCPVCGRTIYPRIVPAVIVGVTDGDRIILTKYAGRGIPFFALIAGFTEIGETLEETVQREVMEEVGLHVKNIRYYKSQPWGIVDDILAGFFCDVDGEKDIHIDRSELKEGLWVKREDIILQPDDYSLTNEMMKLFKDGKEPR